MQCIEGKLQSGDKIWFNSNDGRCVLRICGFTKEQIKKLEKLQFIDITITKVDDFKIEGLMAIVSDTDNIRTKMYDVEK